MGGNILYFGKPHNNIYETALSYFPNIKKDRIAAIGDNIETDIKGAVNIDIDSYLIAGGVHAFELGIKHGEIPSNNSANKLFDSNGVKPIAILRSFSL